MSRTVPWSIKDSGFEVRRTPRVPVPDTGPSAAHWLDSLIVNEARKSSLFGSRGDVASSAPSVAEDFIATGTHGSSHESASSEQDAAPALHINEAFRLGAPEIGPAAAPDEASSSAGQPAHPPSEAVPTTRTNGSMREQAIRDAVAAIMRRQEALDAALPAREVVSPRQPAAGTATMGAIGHAVAALETRLADIRAGRRENHRGRQADPQPRPLDVEASTAFQTLGQDLRNAIQNLDPRGQSQGSSVDRMSAGAAPRPEDGGRLSQDLLATTARAPSVAATTPSQPIHGPGPSAFPTSRVDTEALWGDVRALVDRFGAGSPIETLDRRMTDLARKLEQHLESPSASSLIEDLSRRIDLLQASIKAPSASQPALEPLLRGIEERIIKARTASAEIQNLEEMMKGLSRRLDESLQNPELKALTALETQIERLGQRLDRSEANLTSLDAIETSLRGLFTQVEQSRSAAIDAAEHAARTAARDTLRAVMQDTAGSQSAEGRVALVDKVVNEVQDLRQRHDVSDRRTQAALTGLHMAIEKLVERLARPAGEDAEPEARPPSRRAASASWTLAATPPAPPPAVGAEPDPRSFEPRVPPKPPVAETADILIEPGEGRGPKASPHAKPDPAGAPVVRSRSSGVAAPVMVADGPAPFIAAARRAAQAAQASVAARQKSARVRDDGEASTSPLATTALAMLERTRHYLAQRRRPILLGLAALVLMLGALEVVKVEVEAPSETPTVIASTPAPEASAQPIPAPSVDLDASRTQPSVAAASAADSPAAGTAPPADPPASVVASAPPAEAAASEPLKATAPKVTNPFLAGVAPATTGIGEGLKAMALAGDPSAEYEVGLRYVEGRSVARDPKTAAEWFEKAAAHGLAPAQYRLGSAYEKGVGEPRDPAMAITWYSHAADAGNMRAMHNLAVMSAEGAVGKPDYVKAASLFGKAASLGVRDSQFNLAILYARGLGIEQNLAQSYTWFAIAAAQGDEDAAKKRDEVAGRLDPATLQSAKAAAQNFRAVAYVKPANDVMPPQGGWDAVTAPQGGQKAGVSKGSVM